MPPERTNAVSDGSDGSDGIVVEYRLSDDARRRIAVETGRVPPASSRGGVDVAGWTPDQRREFLGIVPLGTAERPARLYEFYGAEGLITVRAEEEPATAAQWLALARRYAAAKEADQATRAARAAKEAAGLAAAAAAQRERIDAVLAAAAAVPPEDGDGLLAVLGGGWSLATPDALYHGGFGRADRPAGAYRAEEGRALIERVRTVREARAAAAEAAKRAAAEAAAAEKRAWVEAHGSAHLMRACGAGYDCQRLYVTERAARELPGFTPLLGVAEADWRSRSCPSAEALGLALRLAEAGHAAEVVWLTNAGAELGAEDDYAEDDYVEPFEPAEAVVVTGYLGRYRALRTAPFASTAELLAAPARNADNADPAP